MHTDREGCGQHQDTHQMGYFDGVSSDECKEEIRHALKELFKFFIVYF